MTVNYSCLFSAETQANETNKLCFTEKCQKLKESILQRSRTRARAKKQVIRKPKKVQNVEDISELFAQGMVLEKPEASRSDIKGKGRLISEPEEEFA